VLDTDFWKDDLGDERFEASACETKPGDVLWEEDREKIGAYQKDRPYINFYLPPEAFAHFWTAADAREGSTYIIDLEFKSDPESSGFFSVIHVGLHETLSASNVENDLRPLLEAIRQATIALIVVTGIGAIWIVGTLKHWF
jgi:hypothetical protein